MATYAGRYDELLLRIVRGRVTVARDSTVLVYESDGTTEATLYTDRTKATEADNPVDVDAAGNLEFFADPGTYVLSIREDGSEVATNTVAVHPDPVESIGEHGLSAVTLLEWASGGDYDMNEIAYDATYTSVISTAEVTWPDGSTGTFTTTDINETWESIDAFTITHDDSGATVTQGTVTRNGAGLVASKPALAVSGGTLVEGTGVGPVTLGLTGFLVDEDDMASDSATQVPSQQSVKAYVDGADFAPLPERSQPIVAREMSPSNATNVTLTTVAGMECWQLRDAQNDYVIVQRTPDTTWATFHFDVWVMNTTVTTGDVRLRLDYRNRTDPTTTASPAWTTLTAVTVTAPAQNTAALERIGSDIAVDPALDMEFRVIRLGTDGADVFLNTIGIHRAEMVRAS